MAEDIVRQAEEIRRLAIVRQREIDRIGREAVAKADRSLRRKYESPHNVLLDGYTYEEARKAAKAEHMSTRRWIRLVISMAAFDVELGGHTFPTPE